MMKNIVIDRIGNVEANVSVKVSGVVVEKPKQNESKK